MIESLKSKVLGDKFGSSPALENGLSLPKLALEMARCYQQCILTPPQEVTEEEFLSSPFGLQVFIRIAERVVELYDESEKGMTFDYAALQLYHLHHVLTDAALRELGTADTSFVTWQDLDLEAKVAWEAVTRCGMRLVASEDGKADPFDWRTWCQQKVARG